MRHTIRLAAALLLPLFASTGCSRDEVLPMSAPAASTLALRLSAASPDGGLAEASDAESVIHAVTACRFEAGRLQEVPPGFAAAGGLYTFSTATPRGELRLVANGAGVEALGSLLRGVTTLADFERLEA